MSGITLDSINASIAERVAALEASLAAEMDNYDAATADQQSLIRLQMGLQKWTMATNLQSNALKTLGDGLKSTVSNIR
ncbi:EscF/YscF/HrpA family type III secretion system needle major subunit [Acanthopleuribacter pedis]|uniref:EscF/YscF/HrpA family type III secretion system needle major subunit n=1 Tax=Acanthopleuribacter pedis TaxID=442870 RepID=A0A8J7U737_9BACT|nr:EscF/YscF/HrpA family type III secretion system needle major subunit [Acanthopleuribacter pedis]MBO1322589.1 hypothetical protein [Acanthopleuribacter pedis]